MPRRKKENTDSVNGLTDLELELLKVIWERRTATAAEVVAALEPTRQLADTTVHTVLANLRRKGFIEPIPTVERAMRFRPCLEKRQVANHKLKDLISDFFGGSPSSLLVHLIREKTIDQHELKELRAMLREVDSEMDGKEK